MSSERAALAAQGRRLEYFTIGWNGLEGLVAVSAGLIAGSISLVGFGADSFIEVTSGAALLWRMAGDLCGGSGDCALSECLRLGSAVVPEGARVEGAGAQPERASISGRPVARSGRVCRPYHFGGKEIPHRACVSRLIETVLVCS